MKIDDEIMSELREIERTQLDFETRCRIEEVESSGVSVTILEVIATRAVLIIGHTTPRPSMAAIRRAYEQQRRAR